MVIRYAKQSRAGGPKTAGSQPRAATVKDLVYSCPASAWGAGFRYFLPTLRPKTNFSVGTLGSVVVPSWAVPASLVTAGIA